MKRFSMTTRRTAQFIGVGAVLAVAVGAVLARPPQCWKQGPVVDCGACTDATGHYCNGQPCNTTVSIQLDVQTVVAAGAGEGGKYSYTDTSAGSCDVTVRTCQNNVCVESSGGTGWCNNRNPDGNNCTGSGGGGT